MEAFGYRCYLDVGVGPKTAARKIKSVYDHNKSYLQIMAIKELYSEYLRMRKGQWEELLCKALIVFNARAKIKTYRWEKKRRKLLH